MKGGSLELMKKLVGDINFKCVFFFIFLLRDFIGFVLFLSTLAQIAVLLS